MSTGFVSIQKSYLSIVRLGLVAACVSGCAGMSQKDCETADWQTIGYKDALKGKTTSHVATHHEACSPYDVGVNIESYELGYIKGLTDYCTEQNGYNVGRDGKKYHGICPASLEPEFLAGYKEGEKANHMTSKGARTRMQRLGI